MIEKLKNCHTIVVVANLDIFLELHASSVKKWKRLFAR